MKSGLVSESLQEPCSRGAFTAAFDAMPIGISWASISDQKILYTNRAFQAMFGYDPGDFLTVTEWVEATYPLEKDRTLAWERWGRCFSAPLASETSIEPMELHILCKDGTLKTILHGGAGLPETGWAFATFTEIPDRPCMVPGPSFAQQASQNGIPGSVESTQEGSNAGAPWPSPWETLLVERKREREALRISEAMLDRTGHLAGVGGYDIDLITQAVRWSAETYRLHAVAPDYQPTLEAGIEFYSPESRPMVRRTVEQAMACGKGWDFDAQLTRADGKTIWVRVIGSVEYADGKPVRVIGALQDVTAHVEEQNALKEANERLVLATTSGNIGSWSWGFVKGSLVWDERMYRLYGLSPSAENATFAMWSNALHPEDRERTVQGLYQAAAGWAAYECEFRVVWPDGTVHNLHATGRVTRDEQGRPLRMVGANWDVTEYGRLTSELARHGEMLRVTLESIGDGVITTDAHARVLWMNPVAERLTGWQTSQAAGLSLSTVFELIHEETRRPMDNPLRECLAQGSPVSLAPHTVLVARDGTEIGIDDSAAPIRDAQGQIHGVVLVFHDVTEQRRMAKEEARMVKQDLQMKDDFLSHVSHELRSPLASIYSFAAIIADKLAGKTTARQDEYLEIILRNSRQLRSMIDDLLQVTQSQNGKLVIALEPTSVSEAIGDAINTLRSGAEAKQIVLAWECPPRLPPAYADPTRLRQVLIILLDNAIKFTPKGGSVSVKMGLSARDPELFECCVSDTGCGIAADAAEHVFENLYQVSEPGVEGRKGLGLGLYIARDLVIRQGGTIWVDSELSRGSNFCFTVPLLTDSSSTEPGNTWGVDRRRARTPEANGSNPKRHGGLAKAH